MTTTQTHKAISKEATRTEDNFGTKFTVTCTCGTTSTGRSLQSAWNTHSRHVVRALGGR